MAWAATALSGFLYSLAYPPLRAEWVAFVALVPFFLALRAVGWRAALFLGWFWPVFASSFVADALPSAVETYFLQPRWVSLLFAVGVWTVTGSLYYMLFAPAWRLLSQRPGLATPLLGGAAWAACELLRGRLFTGSSFFVGNPWALLAYSQAEVETLIQVASLGGPYAISFVVASANAGIAALVAGSGLRAAALAFAPLLLAVLYGGLTLRAAAQEVATLPSVEIAIVQADVDIGTVWRSDHEFENLELYLAGTARAAHQAAPRVAFWPEAALTFFLEEARPEWRAYLAQTLADADLELVVGGPARQHGTDAGYFNSVFLIGPDGTIAARYDKHFLVPFSEFFPFARLDFLRRRFERVRVFERGRPDAVLLPTRAGAVGVLTCNEAMLPEVAGARARAGAELLASPSNDSWIRSEKWAALMLDMVALRAVETRRWLVRASTSGPSAIVDPWGRVTARTPPFTRAELLGRVAPRTDRTIYTRFGDSFGVACGIAVAAALALRGRRASA